MRCRCQSFPLAREAIVKSWKLPRGSFLDLMTSIVRGRMPLPKLFSGPLHLAEAPETASQTRSHRVVSWLIIVSGFLRLVAYGNEPPYSEKRLPCPESVVWSATFCLCRDVYLLQTLPQS